MRNALGAMSRSLILGAALFIAALPASVQAAVFTLTATNIVVDPLSPLFTSPTISGSLTLADSVMPGDSFGPASVLALTLDFGGISGTLADIQSVIAPGPVQVFGTRSADGTTFSVFDLRFDFPSTTAGCGFVCTGQIIINSPIGPNDPSNFIAIDDPASDANFITSFDPHFTLVGSAVPEPASWAMVLVGLGLAGGAMQRRRVREGRVLLS